MEQKSVFSQERKAKIRLSFSKHARELTSTSTLTCLKLSCGRRSSLWAPEGCIGYSNNSARCHTTQLVRDLLQTNFGDQVVSSKTDRPWPAHSQDLSPKDFWLWSICSQEIRRVKPWTMDGIKELMTDFIDNLQREDVIAVPCRVSGKGLIVSRPGQGWNFEFRLRKKNQRDIEE